MGLKDRLAGAAADVGDGVPGHYDTEVNKGSLNMGSFKRNLNSRWDDGWKLSHVFEQDGNTVMVWERRS